MTTIKIKTSLSSDDITRFDAFAAIFAVTGKTDFSGAEYSKFKKVETTGNADVVLLDAPKSTFKCRSMHRVHGAYDAEYPTFQFAGSSEKNIRVIECSFS